jgi:hypothetical protein
MHFARALRAAGLPVGPAEVVDALRALAVVDIARRDEFRACLRAVLVRRREHEAVFDEAFRLFFRDPFGAEQAMAALLPRAPNEGRRADLSARVAEALNPAAARRARDAEPALVEVEVALEVSDRESLRARDFESMTADELRRARAAVAAMRFAVEPVPTRRTKPAPRGAVDLRAALRGSMRGGGHDALLRFRDRREAPPPLCVICDISGSMGRYTEMLLLLSHALVNARARVHGFAFGTRLSNVTRALRHRDVDVALKKCGAEVNDWAGGTRIGACLHEFNRAWSRRVLGQGAVVLLITDGLERDDTTELGEAAERLHKSCRRLIWLNPLLRYAGFEPRAQGVRALLPHVDEFRPVHNLASLEQLAAALGPSGGRGARRRPPGVG